MQSSSKSSPHLIRAGVQFFVGTLVLLIAGACGNRSHPSDDQSLGSSTAAGTGRLSVVPTVGCVYPTGTGTFIGALGYQNPNPDPTTIEVGATNGFSPSPQDRAQPRTFLPGNNVNAFTVSFDGSPLTWTLDGKPITVSQTSPACDSDPRLLADVRSDFTLSYPAGFGPSNVTVGASDSIGVSPSAVLSDAVTSLGSLNLGSQATVGAAVGKSSIIVGAQAVINGFARSEGAVVVGPEAKIAGGIQENTSVAPINTVSWTVATPAAIGSSFRLLTGRTKILFPDNYGDVVIEQGAKAYIQSGTYFFRSLVLQPGSELLIEDSSGPAFVYVRSPLFSYGSIKRLGPGIPEALFGYAGTSQSVIAGEFRGAFVSPNGAIKMLAPAPTTLRHAAAVYGKSVLVGSAVKIDKTAFPWDSVLPPAPGSSVIKDLPPSPVNLVARQLHNPEVAKDATATPGAPVVFQIPKGFPVSQGNAGNGTAIFSFQRPTGQLVQCTYVGGASVLSPTDPLDRAKGREYFFQSCSDGSAAGSTQTGTSFGLSVTGDPTAIERDTRVNLSVGVGGCGGSLGQIITPAESVAMRQSFNWNNTQPLPANNPDGTPTLFYANIYVRNRKDLGLLDRLLIHRMKQPLFDSEMAKFKGQCGTIDYEGDGQGMFVFAVIPGAVYNRIREAVNSPNVQPEERNSIQAIVLRPIPAGARNANGSLSYSVLKEAGFYYLGVRTLPDLAAIRAVSMPAGSADQIFASFVEFVVVVADKVADVVVTVLGAIDRFLSGSIRVGIQVDLLNRDPFFGTNRPMVQGWGPGGGAPLRLPGVKVTIKQWAQRLYTLGVPIPTAFDGTTDGNGFVSIKTAKGGGAIGGVSSRGASGLCVESSNFAAMITGFILPSDTCDFKSLEVGGPPGQDADVAFKNFEQDVNIDLRTQAEELNAMNQMTDAFAYVAQVHGVAPRQARVLTGFNANIFAPSANNGTDEDKPWTPCLGYHHGPIDLAFLDSIGVRFLLPPGTTVVNGLLASYVDILAETDILMPNDSKVGRDRAVMSHEYGHFTLCSLMFDVNPGAVDTLIVDNINEGTNQNPTNETRYLNEAFADFIMGQVAGGADYSWLPGGVTTPTGRYCDGSGAKGTCWDANASTSATFLNQIARISSLIQDAFDGQPRGAVTPTNGDSWMLDTSGACVVPAGFVGGANPTGNCLVFSPAAYGDAADERVALRRGALRRWIGAFHGRSNGDLLREAPLLAGLGDAMRAEKNSWCDICRVFALHASTATTNQALWNVCLTAPTSTYVGPPPDPSLRLEAASCSVCPAGQFSDPNGVCTACQPGEVVSGNTCTACPTGSIPAPGGATCTPCGPRQISVANTCVDCPFDQGPDRSTNTCATCPIDAALDWGTVASTCGADTTAITSSSAPGDVCSDRFWVDVSQLDEALARFASTPGVKISVSRPGITDRATCEATRTTLNFVQGGVSTQIATTSGTWVGAGCTTSCLPPHCDFGSILTVTAADIAAGRVTQRIVASGTQGTTPVQVRVDLSSAKAACPPPT